ncbi:hypothetical protein TNCV_1952911 [Trichonephila clavipes]|nr:hypothetical protein TNCV_1952911 [Trichonephila clavipes]
MSPTGKGSDEGTSELDRIRLDRKRGRRASTKQKYNESRLVDHARFNDETGNANHNDEIINAETKKSKSSGRNANKTSHSDENQALAREKNVLLRQIDFLNSIIWMQLKEEEPNKSLLATFWIFFRCGQLIFRMADCEVEGTIASSLSIPLERAMSPTGERRRQKEHQN